jgi:hypothetical protein
MLFVLNCVASLFAKVIDSEDVFCNFLFTFSCTSLFFLK